MKPTKTVFSVRLFSVLVILFLAFSTANPAHAQAISASQQSVEKPSLTVNFLGGVGDKLYFEVIMKQPADSRSFLRIRDEDGIQLYNEVVTKTSLVKKVQVPKNEMKMVEFVFDSGKKELKKAYEIHVQYKESLEVKDVTKL